MAKQQPIKVIYGTAGMSRQGEWIGQALDCLDKHNVKTLDTAQIYANSEKILGEHDAAKRFVIDTKLGGAFRPGTSKYEEVLKSAQESFDQLRTKQVDVYYLHAPDRDVPFEETLSAIQKLYEQGSFRRFGLSNFHAEEVQKVYDICKKNDWVLPSVYQGNYSPVARKQEELLFPTLRKLGMGFYAYSPLAGGFLTKTPQSIKEGAGRFDTNNPIGKLYAGLYNRPSYLEALGEWKAIAEEVGCDSAELAYRWVSYNSPLKNENGDGIIVGASSLQQLEKTLQGIEHGPLPETAVKRIDGVWDKIKHEAPLDNFNG